MSHLFASLLSDATLNAAFDKVAANQGAPGADGVTIAAFGRNRAGNLRRLQAMLRDGDYAPTPLRPVDIPKRNGGTRRLMIPSIADRVAQTAAAMVLDPVLDPLFSPDSFAYRSGRSVDMAVRRVSAHYRQGFGYVAETDIRRCFDEIPHDPLLSQLQSALGPGHDALIDLIALWCEHFGAEMGTVGRGLAQGSPLAPLLANLYLDQLDDALDEMGVRFVRFADDFVMLARTEAAAHRALGEAAGVLRAHGLDITGSKTRVVRFDQGFSFLGHLFLRSLVLKQVNDPEENPLDTFGPRDPEPEIHPVPDDDRYRVLYLTEPGRHLGLRNLSFEVSHDDGALMAVHHRNVDRIEIGPGVSVGSEALRHALGTETDIAFVDGHGETQGVLIGPHPDRAALHLAQARMTLDPAARLEAARLLVDARLRNQRAQVQRLNRTPKDAEVVTALRDLGRVIRKLPHAETVEELRGLEGHAAAIYWPALGRLCGAVTGILRRERPAKSPLNAAINYLTAMLSRDIRSAILRAGLHPGFGTLHSPQDRFEALIYDLMEIFRAPLTEGLAVALFNQARLRVDMFDGARMNRDAVRAVITGYEQALDRRISYGGQRRVWRDVMTAQARAWGRYCADPQKHPFRAVLMDY